MLDKNNHLSRILQRLQQTSSATIQSSSPIAGTPGQSRHGGLWRTAREIVRQDGGSLRGLWRGTWPSVLRSVPGNALYFSILHQLREALESLDVLSKGSVNLVGGLGARALAGTVLMPFTVLKTRFESDLFAYKSLLSGTRSILSAEGWRGLFRGLGATTLRYFTSTHHGTTLTWIETHRMLASMSISTSTTRLG